VVLISRCVLVVVVALAGIPASAQQPRTLPSHTLPVLAQPSPNPHSPHFHFKKLTEKRR
jgi:hypothetical protein